VVLIPGLGIANTKPNYILRHVAERQDRVVVNCSWYPQKVNWPLVTMLRDILARVKSNVLFRFYSGGGLAEANHFLPFVRSLAAALGPEHVEVMPGLGYTDYMTHMEEGALCLDAYHYGGCNTVVDCLHLRKPVLTLSGRKWYNRIGGGLLRKVGMDEMVAETADEYIDKAVRLIDDGEWRSQLKQKLAGLDVDALLFNRPEDGQHFKMAIDYLMTHHEALQQDNSREPIRIG
jgi:predicted O-linked N-acetylglucosamine transferase (SPINDLY family)